MVDYFIVIAKTFAIHTFKSKNITAKNSSYYAVYQITSVKMSWYYVCIPKILSSIKLMKNLCTFEPIMYHYQLINAKATGTDKEESYMEMIQNGKNTCVFLLFFSLV